MKRQLVVHSHSGNSRKGAAVVFALMALLVASLLIAALLRISSLSHRQMLRDEFRIQANLLADAGCERAIAQLRNRKDFTGEVWTIPADQLGFERTASVQLKVTTDPAKTGEQIISVVAEYPTGNPDLVRVQRELIAPSIP